MPEFDLQLSRMLWAPPIRPQQGLVEQIINQRFTDWHRGWRFGLLSQQASVSTSSNALLLDVDAAAMPGTEEWGCVVTHIIGNRNGGTTSTATVSFGSNSTSFDNWHAGVSLANVDADGDWFMILPYPDSDGYGSDTPAGAIKKLSTGDTSHDEFRVRNVTGSGWGSSIDFFLYGYYWKEAD